MRKVKIKDKMKPKLICALLTAVLAAGFAFSAPFIYAAFRTDTELTVVVDAGHGGIDGGVTGINTGVKESELNLKIAKIVGECLASNGIRAVYTRVNENGLYTGVGGKTLKRDDMERRRDIIKRAKPSAVVSIHMNSYPASRVRRGAQVFFNAANKESVRFGDALQGVLNSDLNKPGVGREYKALTAEKFILECTSAPVVIAECGFLSNPIDEANLIKPEYQARLGAIIARGVIIFLSGEKTAA